MDRLQEIRGLATAHYDGHVRHVFGSFGPNSTPVARLPFVLSQALKWEECKGTRLWLVGCDAIEVLRINDGEPEDPPIDIKVIDGSTALPALATRTAGRSQLKVQVSLNRFAGRHQFFMDSNQWVEVHSNCVSFQLVAPANFVEVAPVAVRIVTPTRNGFVGDVLIGAAAIEIEESTALNEVTFTENLHIPLNTTGAIRVPPYARSVTIYQNPLGAASVRWTGQYGDPAVLGVTTIAQAIPFIPGARKTEPEIILPDVTFLISDIDAVTERFFTLRWGIVP